jgi:hypothetical protein
MMMNYPRSISGFQTSSGEIFLALDEALVAERRLDFIRWCNKNICLGGEWTAEMVAIAVLENWEVKAK